MWGHFMSSQIQPSRSVQNFLKDGQILTSWLASFNFEEYVGLFLQAGYDMPTISRMTPEDLTAIGITRPGHRKKLKSEIVKLNIPDGLPEYKPDTVDEWLRILRLEQYSEALAQQGYNTVDHMISVAWEDLEDIGIKKLGHQKKMMLAIKRIKDINAGKPLDRHRHSVEINMSGSSSLPRNSSMSVSSDGHYPYGYRTEKIKVSNLHQPLPIVGSSSQNQTVPEFKTFQQSPPQSEMCYEGGLQSRSPSNQFSAYQNAKNKPALSPTMIRSIEALNVIDYNNHNMYVANNDNRWYNQTWRRNSLDTNNSEGGQETCLEMADYPIIGSNSLPRPKVLVKPRSVAKIMAKTRQSSSESLSSTYAYSDDVEAIKMRIAALESADSSMIYASCGWKASSKKTPPAPPKRTNSVRSSDTQSGSMQDEEFACRIKNIASTFKMGEKNEQPNVSPTPSDELPPPPAPLLSTQYYGGGGGSTSGQTSVQGLMELKQRLETIHNKSPVRRASQLEPTSSPMILVDGHQGALRRRGT